MQNEEFRFIIIYSQEYTSFVTRERDGVINRSPLTAVLNRLCLDDRPCAFKELVMPEDSDGSKVCFLADTLVSAPGEILGTATLRSVFDTLWDNL